MRIFLTLITLLFAVAHLQAQGLTKAIEKKYENGKPEIIAYYKGPVEIENLVKKEVLGDDGKKIEEQNYSKGKLSGKSTKWKPFDGTIEWEYNYVDGYKHGEQKEYFSDGEVKTHLNYLAGKLDGEQKGFYLREKAPKFVLNYSGGVFHGPQEEWNPDGSRKYRLNFLAGKLDGLQRWYLPPNGEVEEETWKQGQMEKVLEAHSASQPKVAAMYKFVVDYDSELSVKGEKALIKQVGYYPSGAIEYITELGDKPTTKMMHLSGQPKATGAGTFEKPVGKWTYTYPNGKKMMEGLYEDGQKSGNWTFWNEKEQVIREELWKTGKDARGEAYLRTSCKVIFYYPDGVIEKEGFIDPIDRKSGDWIYHYPDGSLKREESLVVNCKDPKARPFAETITHYDEDERKIVVGSEKKITRFEYHNNGNVKIETEVIRPCRDRCSTAPYEFFKDGEMKVDPKSGGCDMNKEIVLKRTEYRESGDKSKVEAFNEAGIMDGLQEGWHNNGKKKYEYTYAEGKPSGSIKEWYDNGSLMLDLTYHVVDGRVVELKSGTIYTDNGKDYPYDQADGKEMKKKAQEAFDLSYWKSYQAKH